MDYISCERSLHFEGNIHSHAAMFQNYEVLLPPSSNQLVPNGFINSQYVQGTVVRN